VERPAAQKINCLRKITFIFDVHEPFLLAKGSFLVVNCIYV